MIGIKEILTDIDAHPDWDAEDIKTYLIRRLASFETRKKSFGESLSKFIKQDDSEEDKYDRAMVIEFYMYWTEPDRSAKPKMRWEKESTWDTARRLARWYRSNKKNAKSETSEK